MGKSHASQYANFGSLPTWERKGTEQKTEICTFFGIHTAYGNYDRLDQEQICQGSLTCIYRHNQKESSIFLLLSDTSYRIKLCKKVQKT